MSAGKMEGKCSVFLVFGLPVSWVPNQSNFLAGCSRITRIGNISCCLIDARRAHEDVPWSSTIGMLARGLPQKLHIEFGGIVRALTDVTINRAWKAGLSLQGRQGS